MRRESRHPFDDVLIGHLSRKRRPDASNLCLIGVNGSWIWFDEFEETNEANHYAVSTWNSRLEDEDDIFYLLPSEFQPPIASVLLDSAENWEGSTYTVGPAAALSFINERGEKWKRQRPIADASELQEGESLESNAWDHEHCSTCNKHIRPGDKYFSHAFMDGRFFLCGFCHERFAVPHRIAEVIYAGMDERLDEQD